MNNLESVTKAIEGAQAQMQALRDQIASVARSLEFLSPLFDLFSRFWRIVIITVALFSVIYMSQGRSRSGIVAFFMSCTTSFCPHLEFLDFEPKLIPFSCLHHIKPEVPIRHQRLVPALHPLSNPYLPTIDQPRRYPGSIYYSS